MIDILIFFLFLIIFAILLILMPAEDDTASEDRIMDLFTPTPSEYQTMTKAGFTLQWSHQRGFYYVLREDDDSDKDGRY